jgi:hypothetical protein
MRAMLCISTKLPIHRTCTTQTKFDVWTHHPYSDTGPYGKSRASGGVELGDLPQMEKLLHTAERLGAIASAQPVQFWVTEFGWSSNPPNPHGVPMLLEARWVSEAMYQMWKSGVSLGIWFALQDRGPGAPFQSGLYLRSTSLADAQAKPLVAAFRFPFVAYRKRSGVVQVWGRDPTSDLQNVTIQEQVTGSGKWTPVATVTTNTYGMFRTNLALHASPVGRLRANVPGPVTSAPFALWVPNNENMNVTPFPHN